MLVDKEVLVDKAVCCDLMLLKIRISEGRFRGTLKGLGMEFPGYVVGTFQGIMHEHFTPFPVAVRRE